MMIFDTSFLYAYFEDTDVHHKKAKTLMKELYGKTPLLPIEVFEELMTVTSRKLSSEDAAIWGRVILSPDSPIELLKKADNIFQNAWAIFQRLSPHEFSFTDCTLIALSRELSCPILTFDKNLKEAVDAESV